MENKYNCSLQSPSDHTIIRRVDYHRLVPVLLSVGAAVLVNEASGRAGGRSGRVPRSVRQWQNCRQDREAA